MSWKLPGKKGCVERSIGKRNRVTAISEFVLVNVTGDEMALPIEMVVDLGVN